MDTAGRIPLFPLLPLRIAKQAFEIMGWPPRIAPLIIPRWMGCYRQLRDFSIAKTERGPGYAPRVDLNAGLGRAFECYRAEVYV